jgi:hypothetical protein
VLVVLSAAQRTMKGSIGDLWWNQAGGLEARFHTFRRPIGFLFSIDVRKPIWAIRLCSICVNVGCYIVDFMHV